CAEALPLQASSSLISSSKPSLPRSPNSRKLVGSARDEMGKWPCRQMQPVRRSKALEGLRLSTAADHLSTDAHIQSLQPSGSSQTAYACRQQVQDLSTDKPKTNYGKFCKLPNLVFLWSTTLHMLTLIYKQPFTTNLVHKQPPSKNPKEFSQEALFCCSASTYRPEPRREVSPAEGEA
ncbi:hypothetical protein Taro_043817, partial [Colocasia esculenta]|nr:hypothetical protein [Colocasia esculenta]